MGSHKKSALKAQRSSFEASLGDQLASTFEREDARRKQVAQQREAQLRHKACERKKRYSCESEAELGRICRDCERHGSRDLHTLSLPLLRRLASHPQAHAQVGRGQYLGARRSYNKSPRIRKRPSLNQMPPVRASEHTRRRHPRAYLGV